MTLVLFIKKVCELCRVALRTRAECKELRLAHSLFGRVRRHNRWRDIGQLIPPVDSRTFAMSLRAALDGRGSAMRSQ